MEKQKETFLNIGLGLIALLFASLLTFAIINTNEKQIECAEKGGTYILNAEYSNCIK